MRQQINTIFFLIILSISVIAVTASGQMVLDKTFGEDGFVLTDIENGIDVAASIGVQVDGKILVGGKSTDGITNTIVLLRYNDNGLIDETFLFSGGSVINSLFDDSEIHKILINGDGTILIGGNVIEQGVSKGFLMRVFENGQLDLGFGQEGLMLLELDGIDVAFRDFVTMEDESIVAAGYVDDGMNEVPFLSKFYRDGAKDTAFAENGVMIEESVTGRFNGLVNTYGDAVVSCGYVYDVLGRKGLYIVKYKSNSDPDRAFGEQGRVIVHDDAEQIVAHDIVLDSNGRVVLAGEAVSSENESRFMIARFSSNGVADQTFSESGILVHDIEYDSAAYAVSVLADNTIVAAGYRQKEMDTDVVVLKYEPSNNNVLTQVVQNTYDSDNFLYGNDPTEIIKISPLVVDNGSIKFSFQSDPLQNVDADLIITEVKGSDELFRAMVVANDGAIYSAGKSWKNDESDMLISRYLETGRSAEAEEAGATEQSPFYFLTTVPITGITRVGALTGGQISLLPSGQEECFEECQNSCSGLEEEITACTLECESSCEVPSVVSRGVVYSVDPAPEFIVDDNNSGSDSENSVNNTNALSDVESSASDGKLFNFEDYFVLRGQTSDGSGTGTFTSEIEEVNPQTAYFVRAYCKLSDGTILYGNEHRFVTDDACFIATASFGSLDMFAVRALRHFRDRYLLPFDYGKRFVSFYYDVSPSIAVFISRSYILRFCVIVILIPFVTMSLFLQYISFFLKIGLIVTCFYSCMKHLRIKNGIFHD